MPELPERQRIEDLDDSQKILLAQARVHENDAHELRDTHPAVSFRLRKLVGRVLEDNGIESHLLYPEEVSEGGREVRLDFGTISYLPRN